MRKINRARLKGERAVGRISVVLGIVPVLAYFLSGIATLPAMVEAGILVGGLPGKNRSRKTVENEHD